MAAELPLVAPRVGGIPELIEDGVNGFLVEHGDHTAMADRLYTLLDNPAFARRMGEEGKRRVRDHHSPERLAKDVLAAYARQFAKNEVRR
jgi:glycosyltransferase involved in cell wall biosynthesis